MKTTLKMLALAAVVVASASSAFAATRYDRDYGQSQQFENYSYSNLGTDRDSMVEETGN
jgi:hypothetical protein